MPRHAAKQKSSSYFINHGTFLKDVIRSYERATLDLFAATSEYALFNTMQTGVTHYPLRYYQTEALYLLDHIYLHAQTELMLKHNQPQHKIKDFVADLLDKIEDDKLTPFLAYEMATGSGKTMLIGASIYFLNKKYGIDNFLIITPASTDIYQKTIRNFQIGNFESVWADDTPFTFNLITGDNYTQNLFFDHSKDANIFVFNISKFGANATNSEKTWESAIWQDEHGNNISIRQFLKNEKLVIITDEAHHAQTRTANAIIKKFHPLAVLEFTATAIDMEQSDKKNQNIVYKYSINNFLEDGYGKLVRAVALASEDNNRRDAFNDNEKLKIVTLLLIHLLKKQSVLLDPKTRGLKPLSFIKVKQDTTFTQSVFNYIKNELSSDLTNINIILDKIKAQDLEITDLLVTMFREKYENNIDLLREDIQRVADTAIFYYGKSNKETEKKFLNIRKNEVELVVYMQRLDEGIDLPNIFAMAVINDTATDFKTSVKQIIGRGVRLNKEKREFDDDPDLLKANAEKLHIVCDQGKNFEDVITSIQREFGLNSKYLSFDKPKRTITNRAKSDLLTGKFIPHIKADFKVRENIKLIDLINNIEVITQNFIDQNCFEGEKDDIKRFMKYRPDSFFVEVDVFADKNVYHKQIQQSGGLVTTLTLGDKEFRDIYGIVQKHLHCLPDSNASRNAFSSYRDRFNAIGLQYYKINDADEKLAKNLFVNSFSHFYRSHIEKNYFQLDFHQLEELENWNLKNRFPDYELKLPEDQINNDTRLKIKERERLLDFINGQYHFYGYEKCAYDYVKFDVYHEYQLAELVEHILTQTGSTNGPFWIRNERNIHFTYGNRKYYPDFILFKDNMIYVIETKGEIYSDNKKNMLLKRLDEMPGDGSIKGYKGILIFSQHMDGIVKSTKDFDQLIKIADDLLTRRQAMDQLVQDPPQEQRFITYIPVYSPGKAYKIFVKNKSATKPEGWLRVDTQKLNYPKTVFATQVKGISLLPKYQHDSWILMDANFDSKTLEGQIVMVYSPNINGPYEKGFTIRKIEITEEKDRLQLFAKRIIKLYSNDENDCIILSEEVKINVIAKLYN